VGRVAAGLLLGSLALASVRGADPSPRTPGLHAEARRRAEVYAHLMRAQEAAHRRDFGQAAREIREAAELDPASCDLLVEGARLVLRGDPAEAERLARRALEQDGTHREAMRFVAERAAARALGPRRDLESRQEAVTLLGRLTGSGEPVEPELLALLIQLHLQGEEFEAATRTAHQLVARRPGDAEAVKTLAQLLLHAGEEREALQTLLRFVSDHGEEQALADWAEQLASGLEAWDVVVDTLTSQLGERQGPLEAHRLLGEAHLHRGDAAAAVPQLERALAAGPADTRTRRDLAIAYRGVGRLADAVDLLVALLAEGDHPMVRELLGDARAQQGDVEGALADFEAALEQLAGEKTAGAARRDSIRQRMALLCLSRRQADRVHKILEQIEADGGPLVLEIRARLALLDRDPPAARKHAAGLAAKGQAGLAALIEGEAAAQEKHWSVAAERFAVAAEKLGPVALRSAAETYREGGRGEEGLRLLRDWARREATRSDARYWLGVFLYELDRFEEAEAELRQALALDPRHAPALNFLGYSLAERGQRLPEALDLIQRAVALDPWNGAYLDSLGWVHYQMGRYGDARTMLERAAREMPRDPTILEHLGDMYAQHGERDLARTAWDRAIDAGAEDPAGLRRKISRETAGAEDVLGQRPSPAPSRR